MSIADEIRKLNDLLNDGAISQEEFDREKAKLLGTDSSSIKDVFINEPKNFYNEYRDKFSPVSIFFVLILALSIFQFISWDTERKQSSSENNQNNVVQEQTETSVEVAKCERVSQKFLDFLAGEDGFDLKNGYVVNSSSFKDNWSFVSAEAYNSGGLGIDGIVLTWFVDQYPNANYIEGVGAYSETYSSWGSSVENKSSAYDGGYSESKDCVK